MKVKVEWRGNADDRSGVMGLSYPILHGSRKVGIPLESFEEFSHIEKAIQEAYGDGHLTGTLETSAKVKAVLP